MLDQLTDRCGTMGLLVTLSYFYPSYMFWFQISMVIDIACHWIYLQALVFPPHVFANMFKTTHFKWVFVLFISVQRCKAKHHTSSLIQMRTLSCGSTIKKMCSHSCASAMKCSTVDCIYFISPLDPHVSLIQIGFLY